MLENAMVVDPSVCGAGGDSPAGQSFIQSQVLVRKSAHPGRSPKSAANFEGLKLLLTICGVKI